MHVATDATLKGHLQGRREALVAELHGLLADQIPQFKPVQLGSLLWSLSIVGTQGPLADSLTQQVAAQEVCLNRVGSYNTRELCSIVHAYGRLSRQPSSEVVTYVTALLDELTRRLQSLPYVRGSLSAGDFADLAAACAAVFGSHGSGIASYGGGKSSSSSGGGGSSGTTATVSGQVGRSGSGGLPPAVRALLDALAQEVRHQLANKVSTRSPFSPRELVSLLISYGRLDYRSPEVSGMLDAVAGFVVRRIKARHSSAIVRPEELAALLRAFAGLQHNSVSVPELLSAVGEQVCLNAAQEQERDARLTAAVLGTTNEPLPHSRQHPQHGAPSSSSSCSSQGGLGGHPEAQSGFAVPFATNKINSSAAAPPHAAAGRPASADLTCPIPTLNDLLSSHVLLGYAPSPRMLQALAPSICRQLPSAEPVQVLCLLRLLAALGCSPGPAALRLMLARLEDASGAAAPHVWEGEGGGGVAGVGEALLEATAEVTGAGVKGTFKPPGGANGAGSGAGGKEGDLFLLGRALVEELGGTSTA
ncbi:hypothetical protein N2152v2_007583 [Parachlorella kessleri]